MINKICPLMSIARPNSEYWVHCIHKANIHKADLEDEECAFYHICPVSKEEDLFYKEHPELKP